jgi:hypothetical protein
MMRTIFPLQLMNFGLELLILYSAKVSGVASFHPAPLQGMLPSLLTPTRNLWILENYSTVTQDAATSHKNSVGSTERSDN